MAALAPPHSLHRCWSAADAFQCLTCLVPAPPFRDTLPTRTYIRAHPDSLTQTRSQPIRPYSLLRSSYFACAASRGDDASTTNITAAASTAGAVVPTARLQLPPNQEVCTVLQRMALALQLFSSSSYSTRKEEAAVVVVVETVAAGAAASTCFRY